MKILKRKPTWEELVKAVKEDAAQDAAKWASYGSPTARPDVHVRYPEGDHEMVVTISPHFRGDIRNLDSETISKDKILSYRMANP